MTEQKPLTPPTDTDVTERLLGVLMLFFAFFEVLLLTVLLINVSRQGTVSAAGGGGERTGTTESSTVTTEGTVEILPAVTENPTLASPSRTAQTQTLSAEDYFSGHLFLMNASTGEVVAEFDNSGERFSPASMTKVMTLIVACEHLTTEDLDRKVTYTQDVNAYCTTGKYKGLTCTMGGADYFGDEFRVEDLLYGIGVASSADCCVMTASYVCPAATYEESERQFVELMNQKAAEMGLTDTHFDNIAGYGSDDNYTTAQEMSVIMAYAVQYGRIAKILGTETHTYKGYYYKNGVYTDYPRSFASSFFVERYDTYRKTAKKEFTLESAKVVAAKTGYLETSYLVCLVRGTKTGETYILLLGDAAKTYDTMRDIQTVLDLMIQ